MEKVDEIIEKYRSEKSHNIPILQDINDEYRYLPEEALNRISEKLGVPLSELYSLATFYKCFSLSPRGEHEVYVCMGTACHVRGAPRILDNISEKLQVKPGETTEDGKYTLETVNCLGACARGPLVMMDEKYFGLLNVAKIDKMLEGYYEQNNN